jgi:CBS domain-containing protein
MDSPPLLERELRTVMSLNPVTVDRATTLDQVLALLEGYGIRHLPVVECNRLLGMLSDRDLRLATGWMPSERRLSDEQGRPLPGPACAADLMRHPVHSLPARARMADAVDCLLAHEIGAVPVLEGECLVGLVTETDVLRLYAELRGTLGSDAPAREHVGRPLGTTTPEASLAEAYGRLFEHDLHLAVLADGAVVGIVSERDVGLGLARASILAARAHASGGPAGCEARVGDVMSTRLVTVAPETPLWRCAARMVDRRIRALPVLEETRILGLLTQRGILRHLAAVARAAGHRDARARPG